VIAVRPVALAALLALAAGCASVPDGEPASRKYKPLASYASDPFVPVNLYLNANEQIGGTLLGTLVEYSAEQLRASGAFVRVDRGVQRWPITLQVRYELKEDVAVGDTTRRVLGALTLGLVPVHVTQTHLLHAEVLTEPDSVGALELSVTVKDRVSLYDLGDSTRGEHAAADALLERLVAEIAQRKMVPRWAAFKPGAEPPAPPKKKLPRDGRAT
jgi:hypothetical protein